MFFLHLRGEISKNYQGYRLPLGWLRLRCFGLWKKVCPLWTIPIQTIHHRLIQQIVQKKWRRPSAWCPSNLGGQGRLHHMSRYFLQELVLRFSITWRVLTENFQYVIVASTKSLREEKSLLHEGKAVCMNQCWIHFLPLRIVEALRKQRNNYLFHRQQLWSRWIR